MKKLVLKNPVLRFKEGKKIVKAYRGEKVIANVGGKNLLVDIDLAKKNGWNYRTRTILDLRMLHFGSQDAYNKFAKSQMVLPNKKKIVNTEKNISITPYFQKAYKNSDLEKEVSSLGGIEAVLKMLGFTKGNGLDGIWGKNTLQAWNAYKAKLNINFQSPEIVKPTSNMTYINTNAAANNANYSKYTSGTLKPNAELPAGYSIAYNFLKNNPTLFAKKGGNLIPLKNPVLRFKLKN